MRRSTAIGLWIPLTILALSQFSYADSAIPLLSGFDRERVDAAYPPTEDESLGELAKLVYRVRALDPNTLKGLAGAESELAIGDVVTIDGTINAIGKLAVPSKLVEFLEFSRLHVIDVQESERTTRLIVATALQGIQIGDRVSATGVVVDASSNGSGDESTSLAVVSNSLQWFPITHRNDGHRLLSERGFDLGLLAGVATRNRRRLMGEDGEAFYGMLAVAASLGDGAELPAPTTADPVALLQSPQDMVGQWVHMELQSVQITRIALTDSRRQEQLGSDHYFQIDAVGDLGGVVIKIENADDTIPPATFQGRYPVSIVTKELPDFLRDGIRDESGGGAVVASIRQKFGMDGFFFRLWGYESDFMAQQGGGQQFGPLLVSARLENREPQSEDPVGVGMIGTAAAIAVLSAMLMIWWWQRRAWTSDDEARRRRQEYQADQVQLPQ